jgi:hypothetical protein
MIYLEPVMSATINAWSVFSYPLNPVPFIALVIVGIPDTFIFVRHGGRIFDYPSVVNHKMAGSERFERSVPIKVTLVFRTSALNQTLPTPH